MSSSLYEIALKDYQHYAEEVIKLRDSFKSAKSAEERSTIENHLKEMMGRSEAAASKMKEEQRRKIHNQLQRLRKELVDSLKVDIDIAAELVKYLSNRESASNFCDSLAMINAEQLKTSVVSRSFLSEFLWIDPEASAYVNERLFPDYATLAKEGFNNPRLFKCDYKDWNTFDSAVNNIERTLNANEVPEFVTECVKAMKPPIQIGQGNVESSGWARVSDIAGTNNLDISEYFVEVEDMPSLESHSYLLDAFTDAARRVIPIKEDWYNHTTEYYFCQTEVNSIISHIWDGRCKWNGDAALSWSLILTQSENNYRNFSAKMDFFAYRNDILTLENDQCGINIIPLYMI